MSALDAPLKSAGIDLSVSEVLDRLAGIAAAPTLMAAGPALEIVSPAAKHADNAELAEKLETLIAAFTARYHEALTAPQSRVRLDRLRSELAAQDLDGFIVPHADEHQGEYLPLRAERLAWLTGFNGSAGTAIVLPRHAAIFVDGRYTLQVREQADEQLFKPHHLIEEPPADWLAAKIASGNRIGYDPWLHTVAELDRYRKAVERAGARLVSVENNPIDAIWDDQPPPPLSPVVVHDIKFSGETTSSKRTRIGQAISAKRADVAVLTAPDSIAWLLNVRGADVPQTPLPLSFALIWADGRLDWFIDPRKLDQRLVDHLGDEVTVHRPSEFGPALKVLANDGKSVLVDPSTAPAWIFDQLSNAATTIIRQADPCQLPKARKNATELDGTRTAHVRDGAALSAFLAWLQANAVAKDVDEISAARKLAEFRAAGKGFRDLSFSTISGAGPHGAVIHYRVTEESSRSLKDSTIYLVDSGGQYEGGTTDVTRTVAIGTPTAEMKDRFTRVLKGHIALATCRFPKGATGSQLDTLARLPLWEAGLDYDHGTGHGVGIYLGVHEGPQRIAKTSNNVALEPGMILSNEPGYYKTGAYGIRIENLVAVVECACSLEEERQFLGFETLTLAPIDVTLVEPDLLTDAEIEWLNDYHRRVFERVVPLLDGKAAQWLKEATAPISRS